MAIEPPEPIEPIDPTDPPALDVPLAPPLVGEGTPWRPSDAENRDKILDWWRTWFRRIFFPWIAAWGVYWSGQWNAIIARLNTWLNYASEYIEDHAVNGHSWWKTDTPIAATGNTTVTIPEDVFRPLLVGDLVSDTTTEVRFGIITSVVDSTHAVVAVLGKLQGVPGPNTVPTDNAVAALFNNPSLTRTAADGRYGDGAIAALFNTASLTRAATDLRYQAKPLDPLKILMIGTSIFAGVGTTTPATDSVPVRVQALLNSRMASTPSTVVNAGVSGDTTTQMLARLPGLLTTHAPGIVVIELSINDSRVDNSITPATTISNMLAMMNLVKGARALPIFVTSQTPNPAQFAIPTAITDAAMRASADRARNLRTLAGLYDVPVADVYGGDVPNHTHPIGRAPPKHPRG